MLAIAVVPRLGATPLWLDEAYSLGVVHQFMEGIENTGGTMVTYYAALWLWVHVAESPAWLRSLSFLFAAMTMPVTSAIGRRIGGRRLAIVAPPLLAAGYFEQFMAANARSYSMEILVVTVCWYCLIRGIDAGDVPEAARKWWVLLAIAAPLGVLTHGFFILFTCSMVIAVLGSPAPRRDLVRLAPSIVTSAVVVALLWWFGIGGVGRWIPRVRAAYLIAVVPEYTGFPKLVTAFVVLAIAGLVFVVAIGRIRSWMDPGSNRCDRLAQWHASIPIVWLVVPPLFLLVGSVVRPSFVARYFAAVVPAIALCVGLALCRLTDWFVARWGWPQKRSLAVFGAVSTLIVVSWAASSARTIATQTHAHWDAIANIVETHAKPGDGILLYSENIRPPFEAAWSEHHHAVAPWVIDFPRQLGETRRFDSIYPLTEAQRDRLGSYSRVWSIDQGPGRSESDFYELGGPLKHDFRLARTWTFATVISPHVVRVRLYVRDGEFQRSVHGR